MTPTAPTPVRLYLLQLENTTIHIGESLYGLVVSYLIQMSDGTNVLVDTGIAADYQPPAGAPSHTHETDVVAQLAALGLRPDDVTFLVCTHFDPDHSGFHDAFTHAELLVQRRHYEVARSGPVPPPYAARLSGERAFRYAPTRTHWDNPALRYRLLDGDVDLLPGLTLVETSGHAPGHQSVLVRLPRTGPVLLAGDAVVLRRLFTLERRAWPLDDDEAQLRASTRKLLDLVARDQVPLVIFGHDAEQWQTLKKAPEYYD